MDFENVINTIINNGTAIAVTAYFLFRDWKFNENMITTLTALKEAVTSLKKESEEYKNDIKEN